MNAHDAIVAFFLNALRLPTPVTAGPIDEGLDLDVIGEAEDEAIGVTLPRSSAREVLSQFESRDFDSIVVLECHARHDSAHPSRGRASRALHSRAHRRIWAALSTTPDMGAKVMALDLESIDTEERPAASRLGLCTAVYAVRHRLQADTMELT